MNEWVMIGGAIVVLVVGGIIGSKLFGKKNTSA